MNSKILRLTSILAFNMIQDSQVDALQLQSNINFMPASFLQTKGKAEPAGGATELGFAAPSASSTSANGTATISGGVGSSNVTEAADPMVSAPNVIANPPTAGGAEIGISAPPSASSANVTTSSSGFGIGAPPSASSANVTTSSSGSTTTTVSSNGTVLNSTSTNEIGQNATIATPASSSIVGDAGSAENASASIQANNATNPAVADETDAEKSQTAILNTTSPDRLVNSTTQSFDMGNGTIMHRVTEQWQGERQEVNRYQRDGARLPNRDRMSVPAVENAKGPRDVVGENGTIVPIPRPEPKEKEPCASDPVQEDKDKAGGSEMLPYPAQYQNKFKNGTSAHEIGTDGRPDKYKNNYETPSVGIPQAIQGSGLNGSNKYN